MSSDAALLRWLRVEGRYFYGYRTTACQTIRPPTAPFLQHFCIGSVYKRDRFVALAAYRLQNPSSRAERTEPLLLVLALKTFLVPVLY